MKDNENELKILELISQGKNDISQRDIARIIGMSLGMTNSILKRFAEKGLITIRKVNNRNIHYALTSDGADEIGRRSWGYFKRTIKNVVIYREAIQEILYKAKKEGYDNVVLIGQSDLAFIVEHECYKLEIPFFHDQKKDPDHPGKSYIVFAEAEKISSINTKYDFSLNTLVLQ